MKLQKEHMTSQTHKSHEFCTVKVSKLKEIDKTIGDLNKLNETLTSYGACIYFTEKYNEDNSILYRWKFHNYSTCLYMWIDEKQLKDIFDRKDYHITKMRQVEKHFIQYRKCQKYKHEW